MSLIKPNRRQFLAESGKALAAAGFVPGILACTSTARSHRGRERETSMPNILYIMTDQQRFDTIAALGNPHIYTPNLDRLVRRGLTFTHAYSTCPVCVPARATIRTGREPLTTGYYTNGAASPMPGQPQGMEERCGPYLARTLNQLGYRTFGIGKFHTHPWNADLGYEVHLHSEELYSSPEQRKGDAYASFIAREHPEYDWNNMLMGERTEMYYMPQTSQQPAEFTVENWAADRALEQLQSKDKRPYFGFISFVGPHPPFAPPQPFNRMYDPDRMPDPILGDLSLDHMDEQIPFMNHAIWAEDINAPHARILKARYYGEISYIDQCLGRILDAVEAQDDAEDTLICFFSDHGDMLGDHHAWQKECFFEASCHIPFLMSWPAKLPRNERREDLVCLTDLFGIATAAAGQPESRDGIDVLATLNKTAPAREFLTGYYGRPGTPLFKIMVRGGDWKYIFMANGGGEQLFNLREDPNELVQRIYDAKDVAVRMQNVAMEQLRNPAGEPALDGDRLRSFPREDREKTRIYQFDNSRGVTGFPQNPGDVLDKQ